MVNAFPEAPAGYPEAAGAIRLCIRIHEQDAHFGHRQGGTQIDGCRGLPDTPLLVGNRDDSGHGGFAVGTENSTGFLDLSNAKRVGAGSAAVISTDTPGLSMPGLVVGV